ncbi:hypothetical protein [Paraliobacillus sediminis]|uniref:hypothetical protein n=1 Tax=Paraliobacillus sediminis TaxID=1885916 RepID=UPI000E3D31F7|nr:hypothetical protein [Paraliobacillus sediminis]
MGYQIMFYGGLGLAILTLPIAIWLFIKLDILQVIEDLTGLRLQKTNKKRSFQYQPKLTESGKNTSSQIILKKEPALVALSNVVETEKLIDSIPESKPVLAETTYLGDDNETVLLTDELDFNIDEDIMVIDSTSKQKIGGEQDGSYV